MTDYDFKVMAASRWIYSPGTFRNEKNVAPGQFDILSTPPPTPPLKGDGAMAVVVHQGLLCF